MFKNFTTYKVNPTVIEVKSYKHNTLLNSCKNVRK